MGNIRNVRKISKEKGISYAFICKKIGRSHGYLSEIESRDADVPRKSVPLIAEALGVSEEEITGEPPASSQKIDDLAASVPLAMYDGAKEQELPGDIKNMAAAFALAIRQQKKPERPIPPELKEAREILDELDRADKEKLNAALLMLRGLLNK